MAEDAQVLGNLQKKDAQHSMNPVDGAAAQRTTGSSHAPLNTGSTYGNTADHTTTSTTGAGGSAVGGHGGGIEGIAAGIHGLGEKVRGEFNTAVDQSFGESEGVAKNRAVVDAGIMERETGRFAGSTKDREGAVPRASHGRRI
ncbi:hypothetical protein BDZ45DRAFT_689776 [Acephala macrosclerotiorum]|nr:hypothetical protein BDZ45DRAFT_689776 [Acephala macrosclerotiorum]